MSRTGSEPGILSAVTEPIHVLPAGKKKKGEYDNGIKLEYRQTGNRNNRKVNKKIQPTPSEDREKMDGYGSVFGLCGFSLFLLLVPISSSHLEPGRGRSSVRQRAKGQTDSPLDVIKVRKLLLELLQLGFHKPVIRVRLFRSTSASRLLYNQKKKERGK